MRIVRPLLIFGGLITLSALAIATGGETADAGYTYDTWHGRVQRASDGDTMQVDVDGDGQGPIPIRLIGVNAFELGECSADTATDELEQLAADKRVTLQVPRGVGIDKYGRYHAYVTLDSGVDISAALLEAGTVWPVPKDWNTDDKTLEYYRLAAAAQADEIGIWDDQTCGYPPTPSAEFDIRILRNPDGLDGEDPNKEWVKFLNTGEVTVDLSGWGVRSSGEEKYVFPAGTSVAPGGYVKLHAGSGQNNAKHHYWDLGRTMYSNNHAETVVLIDSLGNLRGFKQTPCPENCSDPLRGKVELRVSYDAPGSDRNNPNGEWVEIVNTSDSRINLTDYVLINDQHRYVPAGAARIDAGERLRISIGSGTSTSTEKFWGKSSGILANGADEVVLRNIDGVRIAKIAWPCDDCGADLPDVNVVFVNPDAPGKDDDNLGDEYLVLRNDSGSTVNLRDWAVRSGTNWYRFDDHSLPAGHTIRLVTGKGTNRISNGVHWEFWGRTTGALSNGSGNVQLVGPNLGVADCYGWGGGPCERPERRRLLSIRVNADPDGSDTINANKETIRIKNKESSAIDLSGFRVIHNGNVYVIADNTIVKRNHALTLHSGHGTDTAHHRYWGTNGGILVNGGGTVVVLDADGYQARRRNYR